MKNMKKAIALVLALVMALGLSVTASADYSVTAEIKELSEIAADLTGKTVILHSNDVHGAIDGYAYIAGLKAEFVKRGAEVILADAGDFSQGDPYVSFSKGASAVEMMNAAGYDVITLGNHEFDYGYPQLAENLSKANFKVICADVLDKDGKSMFDPTFVYTTKSGVKIGFFGMETPETQTKVNPSFVRDIKFLSNSEGKTELFDCAQAQVDALKKEGVDLVIGLVHLGVDLESALDGHRSADLLAKVTGIDMLIDGHSHTVMTAGENGAAIQSTGTKFANIGVIVIDDATKKIESNCLIATKVMGGEENKEVISELAKDEATAAAAKKIMDEVDGKYGEVFAKSEVELNGAKAPNGNRDTETNNGDLITEAMLWSVVKEEGALTVDRDHVVAITNGGGIRDYIKVGDVTMKDINTVLPFGNTVAVVYVTGAELLEALEASTFCTPEKLGGYPQTTGIKWTLDTNKAYDANEETYPDSTYYGPKSIQRVSIQSINDKPFDEKATYAVVTNNFCAVGGDTYYVFANASAQFDTGIPLDEAVMEYVKTELKGVISTKYAAPRGDVTVIADVLAKYADVKIDGWYAPALRFVINAGSMTGTGETTFDPNGTITRAQVMKLIANMANADTTPAEGEKWYDKAVAWAVENQISDGENAEEPSTREDFATMLYNYVKMQGKGFTGTWYFPLENSDASEISESADEAMHWMVMNKVMQGMEDGTLQPKGTATRAQMAQILLNLSAVEL